ncbi:hypothetical protein B5S33_g2099 [[Candida] boidinii]|nr:hypothetical protein B5S33_g2099 [[Candida] boidinii]
MNVLNSISPAALFLNSSIQNQHIEITPPKLLYFFIFNPSLIEFIDYPKKRNRAIIEEGPNSSKKYDDNDTQSLIDQLVCYVSFEDREIELSEKANQLSFIQGIIQFTDKFQHSRSQDLSYIDTDISRIIIGKYEANEEFFFVASFEFAYYFPNSDSHNEKNKKYLPNLIASPIYLKTELEKSYKLFTLNFGTLKYYIKNKFTSRSIIRALGSDNNEVETNDFEDIREWWRIWLTKYWRDGDNENKHASSFSGVDSFLIKDKGFLNLFKGYRNSSINLPLGFKENLNVFFKKFLSPSSDSSGSFERRQSILSNSDHTEIEDGNTFYENDEILDIIVMNSNWYPTKNFGVLWCNNSNDTNNSNPDSGQIHPDSLYDLINYIENLDLYIGLSSYSIQLNNMPSIKEYLELIKDVEENAMDIREFLNRSFLKPTTDLINNKILNNFNPLNLATDAITSIGTMTYNLIPDVSSTTNTVLQSVNPFNYSLFGGGSSNTTSSNTPSNVVTAENTEASEADGSEATDISNSNSNTSIDNSSDKSKSDKKLESGSFLVGLNNENNSISFKEVYLTLKKDNSVSKHNLILYEINGILFIIVVKNDYDSIELIRTSNYYKQLSLKLMKIYEIYFEELVVKQVNELNELKSLDYSSPSLVPATADDALSSSIASANKISSKYRRKEFKNNKILFLQQQQNFQETFYYFLYDTKTKEYQTSFPNVILNDEIEILKFMNSFKNVGYEENEGVNNGSNSVSKDNSENKLNENELKLSKLNKLQNIYINKIVINFLLQDYINDSGEIIPVDQSDNVVSELERDELLIKTNKNWWLLRKNLKEQNKVIIIAKKFKQTDSQRFKIFSSSSSGISGSGGMNGHGGVFAKGKGLDNSGRKSSGNNDIISTGSNIRDGSSNTGGRSFSQQQYQQYQQFGNGNNRHNNDNSIIESLGGDVNEWFNTFCKI